LFVDASGRVGIGTSGPGFPLEVRATSSTGQVQILGSDNTNATWRLATPSNSVVAFGGAPAHAIAFGGFDNTTQTFSERARIDSSGRLLVGTSSARSNYRNSLVPNIQLEEAGAEGGLAVFHNANAATGPLIWLGKSRGTAAGSSTVVQDGDTLGAIRFNGADGANVILGAQIGANVDGAPGTNDLPTRLVFSTTADGASSPTERLRITSAGLVGVGTSAPSATLQVSPSSGSANFQVSRGSKGLQINQDNDSADPNINTIGATALRFLRDGGESMRIDTSGRLLVGTSTAQGTSIFQAVGNSSASTDPGDIRVIRGLNVSSIGSNVGAELGIIRFGALENSVCAQISAVCDANWSANDTPGRLVFSTTADGASSPTERLRISSNGAVSFANGSIVINSTAIASGAGTNALKWNSSTGVVTYDTSSRLIKENIIDCPYGIDALKQLRPRKYFRTDDKKEEIGFVADEVVSVLPEFVPIGPKSVITRNEDDTEEVPLGVNYDKLTAVLTKALQEAIAKIESLEARLTAAGI
jgi:hypothetical protein